MIRGFARYDEMGMNVALSLVMYANEGSVDQKAYILRLTGGTPETSPAHSWEPLDPAVETRPTIRLGMEAALALQEALSELRLGRGEYRALRADYDAERARVDRMLGALLDAVAEA